MVRWELHKHFADWTEMNLLRTEHITREKIEQSTQLPNAFDTNHHSCFLKFSLALVSETVLSCLPLSWAYCLESSGGSFLSMGLFMGLCHFFYFFLLLQRFLLG